MWQYGKPKEAALLIDSALRDTTLAGEFSENYTQNLPPLPVGVVPSVFGAAQIIDNALWHDGVMHGDGLPTVVRIADARGVRNVRLLGGIMDVLMAETSGHTVLQGLALDSLALPAAFKVSRLPDGTPRWEEAAPAGPQVPLEYKH